MLMRISMTRITGTRTRLGSRPRRRTRMNTGTNRSCTHTPTRTTSIIATATERPGVPFSLPGCYPLRALDVLCAAGPFLLGQDLYLADITILSMLQAMTFGAAPDAEMIIHDRPG
jgi:hypothetical protein